MTFFNHSLYSLYITRCYYGCCINDCCEPYIYNIDVEDKKREQFVDGIIIVTFITSIFAAIFEVSRYIKKKKTCNF